MAKSKKRPYRKKARTLSAKKKHKTRYILFGTAGFILFIILSILALRYFEYNLKRTTQGIRITQEELDSSISDVDKKLNALVSKAGFVKSEIADKNLTERSYKDLNWQFKDVTIITANSDKLDNFRKEIDKSIKDRAVYSSDNKNNKLTYSISLYGLPTHRLIFEYIPNEITSYKPKQRIKDGSSSKQNTEVSSIEKKYVPDFNETGNNMRSKVVIIVDDIGLNKESIDSLLDISTRLNFAILPNLPYSEYAASRANNRGWDVLLHLPMEPKISSGYTGINAGEGALLTGLSKNDIIKLLDNNIKSVPYIKGVNNHMGSKFTENKELMDIVLEDLKQKGLFYIDSRTTPNTVGYEQAKILGVKTAQRDVFLDENKASEELIEGRLNDLIKKSRKNGVAIGICHPYPNTIKVLRDLLPQYENTTEFVSASSIVN